MYYRPLIPRPILFLVVGVIAYYNWDVVSRFLSRFTGRVPSYSDSAEIKPGIKAPDFQLEDIHGNTVSLSSYNSQVILLNFWATWCAPCVAEMTSLERLYKAHRDMGFVVIAVSADDAKKKDKVIEFARKKGLTFPILFDPTRSLSKTYGVTGYPESFLIDRYGKILGFRDPQSGKETCRVVSERPWDSKPYLDLIEKLSWIVAR